MTTDLSYEDNGEIAFKLLDALLFRDLAFFEKTIQKTSPFQLDKRYPELEHKTLLHRTAQVPGFSEYAALLIKAGADINYIDFRQFKPIHYACECGNLQVLNLLLTHKADINAQNAFGDTPLHLAVKKNFLKIIKILLEDERIDVDMKNNEGYTPLDIAKLNGNENICNMLQERKKTIPKRPINEKMLVTSPMKMAQLQDPGLFSNPVNFLTLFLAVVFVAVSLHFLSLRNVT